MLFEELEIKPSYDSRKTDVYNEFFNSILPQSKYYRRFGGTFSAKRFALVAEGLQEFIKENNGYMELAVIPVFSEEDREAIRKGMNVNDLITKNWINDLSKIKEKFLEDHTKALAWMIANEFLAIKLVLPEHSDGTLFSVSELKDHAIFRREIGIFYNKDNDEPISFHGIIDRDDSEVGELYSIDVSRYWVQSEKDQIDLDHEEFTNFWGNERYQLGTVKCRILPISKELKEYFEDIAPQTKSDIPHLKKLPVLRKYQDLAIDMWKRNGHRGIFEMATGTGKTFAAIGCIKQIESEANKIIVVIAAPYKNLIYQWKNELYKWNIQSVILDSRWRQTLRDEVSYMNRLEGQRMSVFITSHDLFAKDDFVAQIKKCEIATMLVVDEAHHTGAPDTKNGLSDSYWYRLALSATIERYFDQDGTTFIREYFKGTTGRSTVATYSLKKAIEDGRLCQYNYYPFFVTLNEEEHIKYANLTYRAARLLNSKDPEVRKNGEILIQKRARIVRDAVNKLDALRDIMPQISRIKHLLIFCSEKQFDGIGKLLNSIPEHSSVDSLVFRKITYDDPPNARDRIKILNDFANEDWDILLSNRVLDEGMDIPQARRCIVLASTGNPTQFIQRRGRVLRLYGEKYKDGSNKTHADIYDVLVRPKITDLADPDSIKLEISMIKSQLSRIKQMSELALNRSYCMDKIKEFTCNIPVEYLT